VDQSAIAREITDNLYAKLKTDAITKIGIEEIIEAVNGYAVYGYARKDLIRLTTRRIVEKVA
jgi:hypothetical protein